MSKKTQLISILILVAALGVAILLWPKATSDSSTTRSDDVSSPAPTPGKNLEAPAATPQEAPSAQNTSEADKFENRFNQEASKLSKTTDDPEALGRELDILAAQMNARDMQFLAKQFRDTNMDGDRRALAVDLLSRNHGTMAVELLADFAASQPPQFNESRRDQFEVVLRGMSVEGVLQAREPQQAKQLLKEIAAKTDSTFLNDRTQRALRYLKGQAPSPEQQDKKALEKLIK